MSPITHKKSKGFTLIELMMVVTIIGVLGMVAIPSYREYVHNAKIAEAYVGIGAINKAETVHLNEYGYFTDVQLSGMNSEQQVPPLGGSKHPLYVVTSGGYDYNPAYRALNKPLNPDTPNFFAYFSRTAAFDRDVKILKFLYGSSGPGYLALGSGEFGPGIMAKNSDGGVYDTRLDNNSLGLSPQANQRIAVTFAAASLKNDPNQCTFIIQHIVSNDAREVRTSPMITIEK